MLLGRRTYEIFAAYWPYQDGTIAKAFNKATKYVVTRTLDQLGWEHSQRIGGDVVDEVRRLKASDGPVLHIWGSSELLQTLIAAELIDEYRLWIAPVVLGEGKRLFGNGVPPRGLALVETRSTPKGVLITTYRPAGPLPGVTRRPVLDPTTPSYEPLADLVIGRRMAEAEANPDVVGLALLGSRSVSATSAPCMQGGPPWSS